jgi:hypothetical protein
MVQEAIDGGRGESSSEAAKYLSLAREAAKNAVNCFDQQHLHWPRYQLEYMKTAETAELWKERLNLLATRHQQLELSPSFVISAVKFYHDYEENADGTPKVDEWRKQQRSWMIDWAISLLNPKDPNGKVVNINEAQVSGAIEMLLMRAQSRLYRTWVGAKEDSGRMDDLETARILLKKLPDTAKPRFRFAAAIEGTIGLRHYKEWKNYPGTKKGEAKSSGQVEKSRTDARTSFEKAIELFGAIEEDVGSVPWKLYLAEADMTQAENHQLTIEDVKKVMNFYPALCHPHIFAELKQLLKPPKKTAKKI